MSYFLILLSLLLGLFAAPASSPGEVLDSEFVASYSTSIVQNVINDFYPEAHRLPAQFAIDEYRVRLQSTNADGDPIEIVAQFFVPQVTDPTKLPVYVMGAGSTGLVDECAPSREQASVQNRGNYHAYLLTMATQGYITILPDYAGFNNPDAIQPYYVAEMAGRVLLDAGRAVYNFFDTQTIDSAATPDDILFIGGYSQGGQSIFAAKDLWETYAPELPLKGVVGYAPVLNMQSHMLTLPQLNTYRMYAYRDYYGADKVNLDEIFTDHWLPTLEQDVLTMCVIDAVGHFSANADEMYRPEFLEALQNGTLGENYPELEALLNLNNVGFVPNDVPALLVQGAEDHSLPMDVFNNFEDRYCAVGNHLTTMINTEITHLQARQVAYGEVIDWMQQVAAGETPPDVCASR